MALNLRFVIQKRQKIAIFNLISPVFCLIFAQISDFGPSVTMCEFHGEYPSNLPHCVHFSIFRVIVLQGREQFPAH